MAARTRAELIVGDGGRRTDFTVQQTPHTSPPRRALTIPRTKKLHLGARLLWCRAIIIVPSESLRGSPRRDPGCIEGR